MFYFEKSRTFCCKPRILYKNPSKPIRERKKKQKPVGQFNPKEHEQALKKNMLFSFLFSEAAQVILINTCKQNNFSYLVLTGKENNLYNFSTTRLKKL